MLIKCAKRMSVGWQCWKSKTLELTSSPIWSWFCVMKDDCLPPLSRRFATKEMKPWMTGCA
jgi:hypothetical protein